VAAGIGFPHARQPIQITRKRRRLNSKKWTVETVYAITDLAPEHAPPHQLRTWFRGQRAIETSLQWVRDVTYGKGHSRTRTRNGPQIMASIRNLAINLIRPRSVVRR
jgi:predicted transposase YbfD/YdcC